MTYRAEELDLPYMSNVLTRHDGLEETQKLAEKSWLVKTRIGYAVLRNQDCFAILRDKRWQSPLIVFNDLHSALTPEYREKRKRGLLLINGEDHRRLKKMIMPAFTHMNAIYMKPKMEQIMASLLDNIAEKGSSNLTEDVFSFYPIAVLCDLFDIPIENWEILDKWSKTLLDLYNIDSSVTLEMIENLQSDINKFTDRVIKQKRDNPGEDVISKLVLPAEDGEVLSDFDIAAVIEMIVTAGIDTIRNQLSLSMGYLLEHREEVDLLLEDRNRVIHLVEELARLTPTLRGTLRMATEDIEYRGVIFPEGTLISINVASGNRDSDVFPEPNKLIAFRKNNASQILTFGGGLHQCIGMILAKVEMEVAIISIVERFPDIKIDGECVHSPSSTIFTNIEVLPVVFTPKQKNN
jgi:cytochrome P450